MKNLILILAVAFTFRAGAGDTHTLVAPSTNSTSPELTLAQGDVAEMKYCSFDATGIGRGPVQVLVTTAGKTFSLSVVLYESGTGGASAYKLNPIKIAGPATLKLMVDSTPNVGAQFATFDVTRAGTASAPVPMGATLESCRNQVIQVYQE